MPSLACMTILLQLAIGESGSESWEPSVLGSIRTPMDMNFFCLNVEC